MSYIQGDTVWLRAEFYNRSGQLYSPTSVKLKIYKDGKEQLGETIEGESITNVSTGIFEAAYTLPLGHNTLVYEFSGTDDEGKIQLSRAKIEPIWAD